MNRKWIIVEDGQDQFRGYIAAFLKVCSETAEFRDHVEFLTFRDTDEKYFTSQFREHTTFSYKHINSRQEMVNYVEFAKSWNGSIIVLLDALIEPANGMVFQNDDNVFSTWESVEQRHYDDLVYVVSSAYLIEDLRKQFKKKGAIGGVVTGIKPHVLASRALININGARDEWSARYAYPGKKLLHALMLAQACGNQNGHIQSADDIPMDFPLRDTLISDDFPASAFKALFCYTDPNADKGYDCGVATLVQIMHESGLLCDIIATGEGGRIKLPMAPGALYLSRLCYLIRMFGEEAHSNPVTKIEFVMESDKLQTKLHFNKPIDGLKEALKKGGDGTVAILPTLTMPCNPMTPSGDQTLLKTFDAASVSSPRPQLDHVVRVKTKNPTCLAKNGIKLEIEEKIIVLAAQI